MLQTIKFIIMKNRATLLLLGLIISSSFVFSQVSKDASQENYIYPQFNVDFSVEESWQIHKEAYKKQLVAKGLSEKEINIKMQEYEKQKAELIEGLKEQRKLAEKQRQLAEIQRQWANEQRIMANVQRQAAKKQRKLAGVQRQEAEEQRELANEQRELANVQRLEAEEQRELADDQRLEAAEQRELAEVQRQVAEKQRKNIEEWRNSLKRLLNENFNMSGKDSKIKSVKIKVTKMNSLFFNIDGDINSGNVLIEIFNPNGKKEGELSLVHHQEAVPKTITKFSSNTSGSLNKTINAPEIGTWLVKITPEKSNGNINISVAQYMNKKIVK